MNIKFVIESTEWVFEETLPFAVEKVSDTIQEFEMPLYDAKGDETETVILPNCRVFEMEGEDEAFHVVFENDLILEFSKTELDESEIEYKIVLKVDKQLWQHGEDSGIFYSYDNLPETLKGLKIKK